MWEASKKSPENLSKHLNAFSVLVLVWLRGLFEVFSWLGFVVLARPRFQVGLLDFRTGVPSFRTGLRGLETGLRGLRAGLRCFGAGLLSLMAGLRGLRAGLRSSVAISQGLGLKSRSPVTRIVGLFAGSP